MCFFDNVANLGKRTIPVPAVFNHEPGATTSRDARLTRSPLPLDQSLPALARVIADRVNPVPAGLCRRARHENAQARHENLYHLSSMARKRCRGFIERASRRGGLVDLNASDKIDTHISVHLVFEEGRRVFAHRRKAGTFSCRAERAFPLRSPFAFFASKPSHHAAPTPADAVSDAKFAKSLTQSSQRLLPPRILKWGQAPCAWGRGGLSPPESEPSHLRSLKGSKTSGAVRRRPLPASELKNRIRKPKLPMEQ